MKHFYSTAFLCILISLSVSAQDILWDKSYGGLHADYLFDAKPTQDYGFILAGSSISDKSGNKQDKSFGNMDYWVWKMDQNGSLDWQKSYGGSEIDFLKTIITTRDGGFLLAGTSASPKSGNKKDNGFGFEDFWVIKLNADGSEQWQKTLGGIASDKLHTAIETKDGGFLLAGTSDSPTSESKKGKNYGSSDYWIVRLDATGEVLWDNSFGGVYLDTVESITEAAEDGFYILGYSNSPDTGNKKTENFGNGDFWLVRINKEGESLWQRSYGGEGDDHPYVVLSLKDKGLLLGGISNSPNSNTKQASNKKGTDFWVFKLDEEGTILWEQTYDIGEYDILSNIIENKDGSMLMAGYAKSEKLGLKRSDSRGINDYVAIKINEKGEEKWRKEIGSNGDDVLQQVILTRDQGYLLAGTSNGSVSGDRNSGQGRHDFWVVKLLDEENDEVANGGMLEAFPNPTSGYTNVIINEDFENATAGLYDMNGRQVQQIPISHRTVPVNLSGLPIGVYLFSVETNNTTYSVKILKKD